MAEYKEGQRVKFRVDVNATITGADPDRLNVRIDRMATGPEGGQFIVFWSEKDIDRLGMSVRTEDVEIMAPENWPPQVGDIWEAAGAEYFARRNRGNYDVVLERADSGMDRWQFYENGGTGNDLNAFKALNPVLVRRRGQ